MGSMTHLPETIYNGIDTLLFCPKESDIRKIYGIPEDAFMVLGVASFWTEDKGLSLLLELGEKLQENAVIVLVGQVAEQVQTENVICIPRTENQQQLAQLYSAADVYINGSIEETFGMTTAEALACGTPAVVFDSTACPEVVDEQTGLVIQKNVDELMRAIDTIRQRGKASYSSYCVDRVRTHFSESRMAQDYLALYGRILNG